jgi:hypothetical protein
MYSPSDEAGGYLKRALDYRHVFSFGGGDADRLALESLDWEECAGNRIALT